jgi:hypothetical protein
MTPRSEYSATILHEAGQRQAFVVINFLEKGGYKAGPSVITKQPYLVIVVETSDGVLEVKLASDCCCIIAVSMRSVKNNVWVHL